MDNNLAAASPIKSRTVKPKIPATVISDKIFKPHLPHTTPGLQKLKLISNYCKRLGHNETVSFFKHGKLAGGNISQWQLNVWGRAFPNASEECQR